jgi:hypothetical protein
MQLMSNGFNRFKVNGSTHTQMLIVQKMWKNSLTHSNINVEFLIVTHVLINYGK